MHTICMDASTNVRYASYFAIACRYHAHAPRAMQLPDVRSLLSEARQAFRSVKRAEKSGDAPQPGDLKHWKAVLKSTHDSLRALNVAVHTERARHAVEKALLVAEVHEELVTREACAARRAERFRTLEQRNEGSASTYDRAVSTAMVVHGAIAKLSTSAEIQPNGSRALKRRSDADDRARPQPPGSKKSR